MNLNQIRPLLGVICAAVAGLAFLVAACASPGGTKAGGASEPVVLHIATVNADLGYTPQISYLADRVSQLSGGNVRIDHVPRVGNFAPAAEQQVVHGVAAGAFDLGFVGTRIFDTLGVRSFQALSAPMLIDNYPLERAVIGSGIPRQMMTGLGRLRVTGLAVLADGLHKPIAVTHPLLRPRDWPGITFATFKSGAQDEAIRALGAQVSNLFGNPLRAAVRSGKVGAFEKNLLTDQINQEQAVAPYVTANLNLWPQTLAVIADPARLAKLTPQQRSWLQQAAGDAAARSTSMFNTDQHLTESLCQSGARFANASSADLAGLRTAFAPVYASLDQDPQTKAFIAQIQQLKQRTPPGPPLVIPPGCTGTAPTSTSSPAPSPVSTSTAHAAGAAAALAGTWAEASYTRAEFFAAGATPDEDNPDNWGHPSTLKLGHGRFWESGPSSGTYVVRGDKITFYTNIHDYPGAAAEVWGPYTWSVYRDALTFKKAWPVGVDQGPTGLVVKPWHKVSA
jgi:TRAP-type C4-dicarboxylate transport system substrate-binding protein